MRRLFDFLVYGIVVAGILVLTRPGSQGPAFVTSIGQGLVGFIQAITGSSGTYSTNAATGKTNIRAGSSYGGTALSQSGTI